MRKTFIFLSLIILVITSSIMTSTKNLYPKRSLISKKRKIGKLRNNKFLDVSKIKRGMKGYGLTVFSGVKPKRFNVEIIGVLKNDGPKSDLILARFSGNSLEKTGVVAGMSGSPVYINGKLIGAVSHAFPWAKEPIGAIRPIKEMLKVLEKRRYRSVDKPIRFIPLEVSLRKEMEKFDQTYFQLYQKEERLAYIGNKKVTLVPIKTPILFTGIDDRILDLMRSEMESYGLYPLKNGSGGRIKLSKRVSRSLQPGDAVGISLISGDMSATSVGTVTYRRGKEILLFGHPSFFRGPIDMPMTKEYIHAIIPTRNLSFKLASTLFEVGRIFDDRKTAVAGEIGSFSKTIPVQVNIKNEGVQEKFRFRIVKDNLFFPNFLVTTIMQSVLNVSSRVSDSSIKLKFQIKVKNLDTNKIDTVTTHDFFTGSQTQRNLFKGFFRLTLPIQTLLYNPFVNTEIVGVVADLEITNGWKICEVVKIKVLKNKIKPGDTIPILITMKTYKGRRLYKKIFIKIPLTVRSKILILEAGSAKTEMTVDKALSIGRFIPNNYNHLLKILNRNERFNDLVVWINLPEQGLVVNGQEHSNLPSSVLSIMKSGNDSNLPIAGRIKKVFRSNYLIYGTKIVPITINLDHIDH